MEFLALIGKKLKDDDIIDVLESYDLKVVYDFDRLHENIPDQFWATSKANGFVFGFDANQTLSVIFLHVLPSNGFTPIATQDVDLPFFETVKDAEAWGRNQFLPTENGSVTFMGVKRDWVKLHYERYFVHYEFREGDLALVTIQKTEK